ncbi:Ff.00g006070.m01.CDS01 [Fusarium sp. VM40]|nr:Ff.00g006070.m01.CDS01 [Fusarium sp. VM40]
MDSNSSSTTNEPRSFTRGRLSRGKGLRRTTGCLTCRRRHVKCDEVKPRCGGCTRKKTRCEYAKTQAGIRRTRRQTSQENLLDESENIEICLDDQPASPTSDATAPKSQTFEKQDDQSRELSANDIYMPSGEHVLPIESPQPEETVNVGNGDEARHADMQIYQSPQTSLGSHGDYGNRTYPYLDSIAYGLPSPAQLPYHPMSMTYGSPSDASLTLKWLDLLLGDVAINYGPLPEPFPDPGGTNIFGNSAIQSPTTLGDNSVSHTVDDIARLCGPHTSEPRVETRNAYLRERIPSGEDQVREKDQAWQALEPINLQTQELILFRHFTDHISQWMDLFEPQKPFGSLVPHLALHNVGLMNAILALSARHLDIMNRDTPTYAAGFRPTQDDTIGYYYKTLHYCQEAMQYDGYKTSLELLASAFIISAYEMLDGSNTDWEKHLKGVFWIQRSQTIHGHSGGLRQAVWWAWLCQDVWAAFREKRRPFTFWKPNRPLADLNPSELAARAVYNFAHVVHFCARDDASNTPDYVAVKTQEADLLSQQLDYWASYLTSEFQPLPIVASAAEKSPFPPIWIQPPSFAVAMQVYYCSRILLDLHQPCFGGYQEYLGKQRILKRWVGMVCRIAKALNDHASSVLSSQCVFIAGTVVEDPEQRSAILEILDTCSRRAGWPGYSLGRELKEIWRD